MRHSLSVFYTLFTVSTVITSSLHATAQPSTSLAVEASVRDALNGERALRRLSVSVDGREATLTGDLDTFWLKSEAIRRTLEVEEINLVVSEITLPPPESDQALAEEVAKVVQRYPNYTVFDYLDGRVENGTVTLWGKVTPTRNKAGEVFERVAKIRGVQDVQNNIDTLAPSSGNENLRRLLARLVFRSTHFQRFATSPNPPFHIIVDNRAVTLVGYVQSDIEYRELERIVTQTQGVIRVENQLQRLR